jgi:hypothetical protein
MYWPAGDLVQESFPSVGNLGVSGIDQAELVRPLGHGKLRLVPGDSLSVEHPIASDEPRAIKRYLATREDKLAWLFLSGADSR